MARDVPRPRGIETGQSWLIACVALLVLSIAYGAPLVTVVALQPIAAEFGTQRAAPALAVSLTYIGSGMGGIVMGWVAGRIGMRYVGIVCGLMIALGLFLASRGGLYRLYACNLLLLGLLGGAGMFSPTIAYVTRWFDRRRGSAVALVSSGQYVAGAIWPVLLQIGIDRYGWRRAMMLYGILIAVTVPALTGFFYRRPPEVELGATRTGQLRSRNGPQAQFCAGDPGRGNLLLLRDDVDPARAYCRVLRRYRRRREIGRDHAVAATRHRRDRATGLGLDR